jgi:hypothetical protein
MVSLIRRLGIRSTCRAARDTVRGGGPAGFRLVDVHTPEGFIVPTVTVDLEVPLKNGDAAELSPGFPLPPPLAWSWRVGKVGSMLRDRVT